MLRKIDSNSNDPGASARSRYAEEPIGVFNVHGWDSGGTTSLSSISRDPDALSVEDQVEHTLADRELRQALESLTPQVQHFLTRRYGFKR